jgi:hypothetical protein
MKLFFSIFLFLIFSTDLLARTEIGIGLVEINFDDKTVLEFYEKPVSSKPAKRIEFFNDEAVNGWNIRNLERQRSWLKPESLWLDYHSFVFRAIARRKNWYRVTVNNETGKSYWLRKQKVARFKTWEQFLTGMFGVKRATAQKIRRAPSPNSPEIKYLGKDCFQVKGLRGEWLEIFSAGYCDEDYTNGKTPLKSGWIKWRNGNKLLIDYFITS